MAGVPLDQLPPTVSLNGNELFFIYQQGPTQATPWIGQRVSLSQLSTWFSNPYVSFGCTMRQLAAALSSQGNLTTVVNAIPPDVNNPSNIAWVHGTMMSASDSFSTDFLQPVLGYTNDQMNALYELGLSFPA